MSNIFKTNSRFASLFEDETKITKDNKYFTKNENNINSFKPNKKNNIITIEKQEIKQIVSLSIDNFPELVSHSKSENIISNNMNFVNIISNEDVTSKENNNNKNELFKYDNEYENLQPGCTLLKRDKITGKTIIKHKPTDRELQELERIKFNEREKSEKEIVYDVFKRLAEIYEERTKEYIESWGYDEWERMFRFPNYDYEYFDKLDQKYEEEMAELEMAELEKEKEQKLICIDFE